MDEALTYSSDGRSMEVLAEEQLLPGMVVSVGS